MPHTLYRLGLNGPQQHSSVTCRELECLRRRRWSPHIVWSWSKRSSATQLCHLQRIRVLTAEAVVQSRHSDLAVDPDEIVLQLAVWLPNLAG